MIDFHSHILPAVDDGSKSLEESIAMLELLSLQGVECVVATPHFYANHESVEEFLARRAAAYEALVQALPANAPNVVLGAEVRYYEGISRMPELSKLCIGDSKLLLLEMPMSRWTEYTVRELIDLSCTAGVKLVLAHIERYWSLQSRDVWDRLLANDILMQVNASFFLQFGCRRKAIRMLDERIVRFIGSDCHNMTDRKPRMDQAVEAIRKKLGDEFLDRMNSFTLYWLNKKR